MISGRPQKGVPYIVTESSNFFMAGDTVYLIHDDGTKNPWFSRDSTVSSSSRYAHDGHPLHIENISNATEVRLASEQINEGVNMKVRFEDYPIGTRFEVIGRGGCLNVKRGAIIEKTSGYSYKDINSGDECGSCFNNGRGELRLILDDHRFKVGDRVRMLSKHGESQFSSVVYNRASDGIGYITAIDGDGTIVVQSEPKEYRSGDFFVATDLELVNEEINNKGRIAKQSGEEKMSEEQTKRPEYVIIVKNTEVFKKGGVFKYYASFYAPVITEEAYTVKPYGDEYIRHEQVDVLLEKKIAVEAVQFNPAFVTLEQNEVLQNALTSMTKKTTKKKTVAKKAA